MFYLVIITLNQIFHSWAKPSSQFIILCYDLNADERSIINLILNIFLIVNFLNLYSLNRLSLQNTFHLRCKGEINKKILM